LGFQAAGDVAAAVGSDAAADLGVAARRCSCAAVPNSSVATRCDLERAWRICLVAHSGALGPQRHRNHVIDKKRKNCMARVVVARSQAEIAEDVAAAAAVAAGRDAVWADSGARWRGLSAGQPA